MVHHDGHFGPIATAGELPPRRGLRLGRRRDVDVPLRDPNHELVFLDGGGRALDGQLTAGERFWGDVARWVSVDMSTHTSRCEVGIESPNGQRAYVVGVALSLRVVDARAVAELGVTGTRDHVEPVVRAVVRQVASGALAEASSHRPSSADDELREIAAERMKIEAALLDSGWGRALTDRMPRRWLEILVISVDVQADPALDDHLRQLRDLVRQEAVVREEGRVDVTRTEVDIDLRNTRRKGLVPHLSDPVTAIFEVVVANPSEENIERVVSMVREEEIQVRGQMLGVLEQLLSERVIDTPEHVVEALRALRSEILAPRGHSGPSSTPAAIGIGVDDTRPAATHRPTAADPGDDELEDDRW